MRPSQCLSDALRDVRSAVEGNGLKFPSVPTEPLPVVVGRSYKTTPESLHRAQSACQTADFKYLRGAQNHWIPFKC